MRNIVAGFGGDWDLDIQINQDRTVTLAETTLSFGRDNVEIVHGSAVRYRADEENPNAGAYLALGRALEIMGKRLQKRAMGLIKHGEDIARMLPVQRARKAFWLAAQEKARVQEPVRQPVTLELEIMGKRNKEPQETPARTPERAPLQAAGRKGGIARAKNLSPRKRRQIARKAALARWGRR